MFQLESLESDFLFEMSKQKHNLSFTIQGCISEYGWICTMAVVDSDLLNKTYTERRARSLRARALRADFLCKIMKSVKQALGCGPDMALFL